MAFNVEKATEAIINEVGGTENISSVTHCVTRLRFVLKDDSKVNKEELKKIEGVLDVVYASGQCQIVLAQNLFPVYDRVINKYGINADEIVDENHKEDLELEHENKKTKKGFKYYLNVVMQFLASSLAPFITVLYGAGMLRVIIVLVAYFWPSVTANSTYTLFNWMSQVPFYFMPVFVAYGCARTLKANPAFAIAIACALIYPDFVSAVANGTSMTMFGLSVTMVKYSSSLLPAIFGALLTWWLEKYFYKVIPGVLRSVFAPLCVLAIAFPIEILFLAPLGTIIGSGFVTIFMAIYNFSGGLAVGVLAAVQCYLVLAGMNMLLVAPMTEIMSSLGYDPVFRAGWILHNVAEGGAALGVALKTKNKQLRSDALSCVIGATISGVSEPSIYGIDVRLKKPFIGVTVGGFAGGCVAGFMGAKAYSMGYSSILGAVLFGDTMLAIIIAIIVSFVVSAAVTYIVGFEDIPETKNA